MTKPEMLRFDKLPLEHREFFRNAVFPWIVNAEHGQTPLASLKRLETQALRNAKKNRAAVWTTRRPHSRHI